MEYRTVYLSFYLINTCTMITAYNNEETLNVSSMSEALYAYILGLLKFLYLVQRETKHVVCSFRVK